MVSAFQSREYGFGYCQFQKIKEDVSTYRRNENYLDADAVKGVLKMDSKMDL